MILYEVLILNLLQGATCNNISTLEFAPLCSFTRQGAMKGEGSASDKQAGYTLKISGIPHDVTQLTWSRFLQHSEIFINFNVYK